MKTLTEDEIIEIADQLDIGFRCYVNKKTNVLLLIPNEDKFGGFEEEMYPDELEELDKNADNYFEIEAMYPTDEFNVMESFIENIVDDTQTKSNLLAALSLRKPFRQFKDVLDDSDYKDQWFQFKKEKQIEWVKKEIEGIE